jgi:hypothetical protein
VDTPHSTERGSRDREIEELLKSAKGTLGPGGIAVVWTVRGCDCDAYMERVEWRQSRPAALYIRAHAESQYAPRTAWDTARQWQRDLFL